jgi:glucose/arabinose dehydrogenase
MCLKAQRLRLLLFAVAVSLFGCHSCVHVTPGSNDGGWCDRPGAWVHASDGYHQVGGGSDDPGADLSWLSLPEGYCAHYFGNVGNCRQLRFAPGGELFVASPTTGTTSGGAKGQAAIIVLTDDDHDGTADSQQITWRGGLTSTQGLLFVDGGFYFQDQTRIMLEPYKAGDRAPTGTPQKVADITVYSSGGHWPKTLDQSDDGTIYVSNGGDQGETCQAPQPFHGGILALDPSDPMGAREVAKGLRNPIYVRCHHDGHGACFADELARDYSENMNGREKLLPIRAGDDWGYPCCGSQNLPYTDACLACSPDTEPMSSSLPACTAGSQCSPKCEGVVPETASFVIGDTPFGLDFIDGQFPSPWDHHVFVAPHGAFGSWVGARVVGIAYDPSTNQPATGSNLPGESTGAMKDFATGWDDGNRLHGRPADVTVSTDGRLFVSSDEDGVILWIAPISPP